MLASVFEGLGRRTRSEAASVKHGLPHAGVDGRWHLREEEGNKTVWVNVPGNPQAAGPGAAGNPVRQEAAAPLLLHDLLGEERLQGLAEEAVRMRRTEACRGQRLREWRRQVRKQSWPSC